MADRLRADDGPLIVVFGSSLVSSPINLKEKSKLDPPLRLSGSAHKIETCCYQKDETKSLTAVCSYTIFFKKMRILFCVEMSCPIFGVVDSFLLFLYLYLSLAVKFSLSERERERERERAGIR